MSISVLSESTPVASKDYDCMACEWINNKWGDCEFTVSELKLIAKARRNDYKVKKGDKYIRQSNKYEGKVYDFIAIPEMHDICLANDIYEV